MKGLRFAITIGISKAKIILYVMMVSLCLISFSCKKDSTKFPAKTIYGTWRWFKTYCICPNPPATPDSVGYQEIFIFYTDGTWKRIRVNTTIDSGIYHTGHGSYTNYTPGGTTFSYDSVSFYKNNIALGWDSYLISHDTLIFGPGLSGRFNSYLLPYNGSIWLVKTD